MRSAVSLVSKHVTKYNQLLAPLLLCVSATLVNVQSPVQHSLFVAAFSWLSLFIPLVLRVGLFSSKNEQQRRKSWIAAACLCFSQICDRAACDKEGIWMTRTLMPLAAVVASRVEFMSGLAALPGFTFLDDSSGKNIIHFQHKTTIGSYGPLMSPLVSAIVVLRVYNPSSTFVIGLCSVVFAVAGLLKFEATIMETVDQNADPGSGDESMDGQYSRQIIAVDTSRLRLTVLRDVAGMMAVTCGLASYIMEPSVTMHSISWESSYGRVSRDWRLVLDLHVLQQVLWTIPVQVCCNVCTFIMLSREGTVYTSLIFLFSFVAAKFLFVPSFVNVWFTCLYSASALFYTMGQMPSSSSLNVRNSIGFVVRPKRAIFGIIILSIGGLFFRSLSGTHLSHPSDPTSTFVVVPPSIPFAPVPIDISKGHPATQLINIAENEFESIKHRQSKSLVEAVQEYRKRYGIAPPPHFDKWYEFAARNDVVMIDEFDTIHQMLLPFWAIKPATIRSRITNALGYEDIALIGVAIRNGAVRLVEHGEEWQRQATVGMMKSFVQYLPDMDLGFNMHDEPRVVVPNNLLSAMLGKAQDEVLPHVAKNRTPRNAFSKRPDDVNDGNEFQEASTTTFNRFAHQQTWTQTRLSCPANAPAQAYEDVANDNLTSFATTPLGYIYNTTAFSDICNSPSFSSTFGFFERPNTFNVVLELTPIFSPSKISSFQDLLYPSPWYWKGKVTYEEAHDTTWENKTNSIYWRGSTTGGYSRNGGWRRQHRQHIVKRLNDLDTAQVLVPASKSSDGSASAYSVVDVDRRSLKHLVNVKFSHIGQCDPGDCDAQKEFFHVTDRVDSQYAWYHKHLLDMDGNAFSGRFYTFLKSRSLTYKMAVFREWHTEWLRPWVHYIPMSLKGDEHLDLIKWFSGDQTATTGIAQNDDQNLPDKGGNGDSLGERKAREIAERSTEWHDKVLRNVDFEVWFFRLLLEYGRVIDDYREEIGYAGP